MPSGIYDRSKSDVLVGEKGVEVKITEVGVKAEVPSAELFPELKMSKMEKAREEKKLIGCTSERKVLELAIEGNFPALLEGETGVGKTYILQNIAKANSKKIIRMSLNGEVGINELCGKWLVKDGSTYWQDGVLVECMRHGWWIIMDEINSALPEVLFCLNALLDDSRSLVLSEKDGELVTPHTDFRFFATMNPPDEYAGTKEMNKALMSRFPIVLHMDNYKPATELEIVKYQSGIDDVIARCMVDVANAVRKLKKAKKIWYTCSTRDVVNWARLLACNGNTFADTFRYSILNKASAEDKVAIQDAVKNACAVKIEWDWSKDDFPMLTKALAMTVEKLQKQKDNLESHIDGLVQKAKDMKKELDA